MTGLWTIAGAESLLTRLALLTTEITQELAPIQLSRSFRQAADPTVDELWVRHLSRALVAQHKAQKEAQQVAAAAIAARRRVPVWLTPIRLVGCARKKINTSMYRVKWP